MQGEELILRFLALSNNWRNYKKPLVAFLNNYSEKFRVIDNQQELELAKSFKNVIDIVNLLYGNLAFKTFDSNFRNTKFNAALYDAQSMAVFELDPPIEKIRNLNKNILHRETFKLISSPDFNKYIASGTTDKKSVTERIRLFSSFLEKFLN
jgi:hypothetical protein